MDKIITPASRSCRTIRCLHSSARNAAPGPSRKPRQPDDFSQSLNVRDVGVYHFDDPTSLGWMRLEKVREAQELFRKLELDKEILQAQAKPFNSPAPTQSVRIRSTIDLSYPSSSAHRKSVLVAPIGSLPLKGPEAVQRVKLLAGPRWSPGYPGKMEQEAQGPEDKDGWIKIAEERFTDARTNRWNVGQILEKLVEAANDPGSAIPASAATDMRHLLSKQRKKRTKSDGGAYRKSVALGERAGAVGGVRGFPKDWIHMSAQP